MKVHAIILALLLASVTLQFGCEENPFNSQANNRPHSLRLVDSTLSIEVQYATGSMVPDVLLRSKLTFISEADSASIENFSVDFQGISLNPPYERKTFRYSVKDSVIYTLLVPHPSPFVEYPTISLRVISRTYADGKDSLQEVLIRLRGHVDWNGQTELGLREIPLPVDGRYIHRIIWKHGNQGFYFTGSSGGVNEHLFYSSVPDYSVNDISYSDDSYSILDLSHDDRYLLACDNNGRPSNVYLYDIQSNVQRLLISAQDSLLVGGGAFSSDDSKIVFSTVKLAPVISEYPVYLFTRLDSSLRMLPEISILNSTTIDRWLPNSNDRFTFHNHNTWLSCYSISQKNFSTTYFPSPHYPWKLSSDGNSIVGLYLARIENDVVMENHLFLYSVSGQVIRQLTFYPEIVLEYSMSPDRTTIVFSGYRNSRPGLWIKRIQVL